MRAFELVAVLVFLLGSVWAVSLLWREWARRQSRALRRWREGHQLEPGASRRLVFVERQDEREPIGAVSTSADDYDDRLHQLMSEARERAAVLNSEEP